MATATAAEYIKRIRALTEGREPWEILSSTASELQKIVKGVDPGALRVRASGDQWSGAEIMAHLADSELMAGVRFRQILSCPDGTTIPAYDQNAWARVCGYDQIAYQDSLDVFRAVRNCNLRLLQRLDPGQRNKFGLHQERGQESISDVMLLLAGHDINHLQQISSAVQRLIAAGPTNDSHA
jgi:cold shock CspA family protein